MSSAVDSLADNLKNASVEDPVTSGQDSVAQQAALASAAEGRRLYIGNLAYATTEGQLQDFFKDYAVENTSIPVNPRTTRPVGYAFVDLKNASDAQTAIDKLSGETILDRKVSVQFARKPEDNVKEDGADKSGRKDAGRGRGRGGRSRGRGGRSTGARVPHDATEAAAEGAIDEPLPLTETTNEANEANKAATTTDGKPRAPRQPKQRGPPEDGIPSSTKVMVANLPYDLREEKLKELFAAYNPVSAKIALRPIPRFMVKKLQARGEPRKGRGFGFVTLESEEQQKKAVDEMNGKEIEGREIAVKVAIDSPGKEDGTEGDAIIEDGANGTTEETKENATATA